MCTCVGKTSNHSFDHHVIKEYEITRHIFELTYFIGYFSKYIDFVLFVLFEHTVHFKYNIKYLDPLLKGDMPIDILLLLAEH